MELFTYKEWRSKGYQVVKGQKCVGVNKDKVAVFTIKQVKKKGSPIQDGDYDYDGADAQYFWDTYGYDRDY